MKRKKSIISASRRTDIPAFFAEWFINRIRAGYCTNVNPLNKQQVSRISLKPEDVEVIVFWTRNPEPLMPYLDELNERGYRYYFQYTVLNYSRHYDQRGPTLEEAVRTFKKLSEQIGRKKVIWRYDPILFTDDLDVKFHAKQYAEIAAALEGNTERSIISIADITKNIAMRMSPEAPREPTPEEIEELMTDIGRTAIKRGMEIYSCAERYDLSKYGILKGKCIDDELIKHIFGVDVTNKKDKGQREECGCVQSKDIGMYNTCRHGCKYCYATRSNAPAAEICATHNPSSPSLVGQFEPEVSREDLREENQGKLNL